MMINIQTTVINTDTNKVDKDVLISEKDIDHNNLGNVGTMTHAELEEAISKSADKTYTYVQGTPSAVWTIVHNMNKMPSVVTVDQYERPFYGGVTYLDNNTLQAEFDAPRIGKAYLN